MIEIAVSSARAEITQNEILTAGRSGLLCRVRFGADWEGLEKIAVFSGSGRTVDVPVSGEELRVPAECLREAGSALQIGFYGSSPDGSAAIPTLWVSAGPIRAGTTPSGGSEEELTPSLAAQLQQTAAEALAAARSLREDADRGAFIGPAGPPYTLTEADRASLCGQVAASLVLPAERVQAGEERLDSLLPRRWREDGFVPVTVLDRQQYEALAREDALDAERLYLIPEDEQPGESAYEIAVRRGFSGTEAAWLASLVGPAGRDGQDGQDGRDGQDGQPGESAYEIAVQHGFSGSEADWLASLVGPAGMDGQPGMDGMNGMDGHDGQEGPSGESAYEIAVRNGFSGSEAEWLASLVGQPGEAAPPLSNALFFAVDGTDVADGIEACVMGALTSQDGFGAITVQTPSALNGMIQTLLSGFLPLLCYGNLMITCCGANQVTVNNAQTAALLFSASGIMNGTWLAFSLIVTPGDTVNILVRRLCSAADTVTLPGGGT